MELERIQAQIRPRKPCEAVDLGFAMVRRWHAPLYRAWIAAVLPVMILVLALGYRHPFVAALILWWCKPLLDRVPLHFLSRALFGETTGVRAMLGATFGLLRRSLLRALLRDRFIIPRSFTMPVDELEGLRGGARRSRLRVLGRRGRSEAARLALVSLGLEMALISSLLVLGVYLLPPAFLAEPFGYFWQGDEYDSPVVWRALLVAQMLSILFLEPFYVAGGFFLYLNRRVDLEAWDIEIAFRRMASRSGKRARHAPRAAAVLAVLCLMIPVGFTIARTDAEDAACPPTEESLEARLHCIEPGCKDARVAISAVLEDPVFGSVETVQRWRLGGPEDEEEESVVESTWLESLASSMAGAIEPVLWAAALLCIAAFIVMRPQTRAFDGGLHLNALRPQLILGLDLRGASLPDDIPGRARHLEREGRGIEAVSLLFRGALADLAGRDGLPLAKAMTEGECTALVTRSIAPDRSAFFRALATTWTRAAYGHRPPESGSLMTLIDQWPSHFRGPS